MHYTSTNGHLELLKWLMSQGISLTTTNAVKNTDLLCTCTVCQCSLLTVYYNSYNYCLYHYAEFLTCISVTVNQFYGSL